MFGHLLKKEIRAYFLDGRFIGVFAVCALLSGLAVLGGVQHHVELLGEYQEAVESRRTEMERRVERTQFGDLYKGGVAWSRPPQVLSTIVGGLSDVLGREAEVIVNPMQQYQPQPHFESSPLETKPATRLFGRLDIFFIVKIALSLAVLLFTYDSICGEKENGTLRLWSSFPVSRATIALAKLAGAALVVSVAAAFSFLLAAAVLTLFPDLTLSGDQWMRLLAIFGVLILYLLAFAAFGLWASALTHRRSSAFLGLMGLWLAWIYVIPTIGLRAANSAAPQSSFYEVERQGNALRWQIASMMQEEALARRPKDDATMAWQWEWEEPIWSVRQKWLGEYRRRLQAKESERQRSLASRREIAEWITGLSPVGPATFASMELAQTGFRNRDEVDVALRLYREDLASYVLEKGRTWWSKADVETSLKDFTPFIHNSTERAETSVARQVPRIAHLALLVLMGFVGAFVTFIRYDVR